MTDQIKKLPPEILEQINKIELMRRDFVANVSHELRTPLTVIHGYLELLLDQENEELAPWCKMFRQMHQHSIRMQSLIEDLLLLSRLESTDNLHNEERHIHIAELLTEVAEDAKNFSGSSNHHIELITQDHVLLNGNVSELKSLFSNLVFNAVKYTPPDGHITIEWFGEDNCAIFQVTDNGIGILEEHISRLTERFYRVDKDRSRESGGTGLGLAIAKHVLLRHSGQLNIQSRLHHGSTFSCIFPTERSIINALD